MSWPICVYSVIAGLYVSPPSITMSALSPVDRSVSKARTSTSSNVWSWNVIGSPTVSVNSATCV